MNRQNQSFDRDVIEAAKEALTAIPEVNAACKEYVAEMMLFEGDPEEFNPEEIAKDDQQRLYWELYSSCQREIILQALTEL
jgi:hypothetical protein